MINVNTNNATTQVNWQSVSDLMNASGNEGVNGEITVSDKGVLTLTTKGADGVTRTATVTIPQLDAPEHPLDTAALQNLADKLVAGLEKLANGGILSEADFSLVMKQASTFSTTVHSGNTSKALFDLYALMALMVEVAQKQRDTAREIRQTENAQIQHAIQTQAEEMRNAAVISLVMGCVSTAISGVMSGLAMYNQAKAFTQQSDATSTLKGPSDMLKMTMLENDPAAASQMFTSVKNQTPEAIQTEVNGKFADARTLFQEQIGGAKNNTTAAETRLNTATERLNQVREGAAAEPPTATAEEVQAAQTEFDNATRGLESAKLHERTLEHGFFSKLDAEIKATDAGLSLKKTELAAKQNELSTCKNPDRKAELTGEINTLKNDIKTAETRSTYLKAYTTQLKSVYASPEMKNLDIAKAQRGYDFAKHELELNTKFTTSQQMMNRWMGIQQLSMSVSQMVGNIGNMVAEQKRAAATMEGVEQELHREQLDQIKDLFAQGQNVVQAVIQLMQAVLSAENESLMEAIRV
ncbi:MAG: type III secretion system translocon subunit SctB [Kiritimatiellae bacterium]|nr:type III secretion system translocon subunit SctB [Kiritimatiellia bacterium]